MIREVTGDILKADVEALVNPVNTDGVMGAGLARQVKLAYPGVFREYTDACRTNLLAPGYVMFHRVTNSASRLRYIVSFPTKQHWRDPSRLEWVRDGLMSLRDTLAWIPIDDRIAPPIRSIALPRLGCGLGCLHWTDVRPLIHEHLNDLADIEIIIYSSARFREPERKNS